MDERTDDTDTGVPKAPSPSRLRRIAGDLILVAGVALAVVAIGARERARYAAMPEQELLRIVANDRVHRKNAVRALVPHANRHASTADVLVGALSYGPLERIYEPAADALRNMERQAALGALRRGLLGSDGWTARFSATMLGELGDPGPDLERLLRDKEALLDAGVHRDVYGIRTEIAKARERLARRSP